MISTFIKTLIVSLFALGALGGVASAQNVIENTGPDSVNEIVVDNNTEIDIDCNNDIQISNDNDQNSSSGNASVEGNTTGGSATSGNSSNTNSTNINVISGCGPVAQVLGEDAPKPGKGGDKPSPAAAVKVAALPKTGETSPLIKLSVAAVVAGSTLLFSAATPVAFGRR